VRVDEGDVGNVVGIGVTGRVGAVAVVVGAGSAVVVWAVVVWAVVVWGGATVVDGTTDWLLGGVGAGHGTMLWAASKHRVSASDARTAMGRIPPAHANTTTITQPDALTKKPVWRTRRR
jgi:hypothetical protein